MIQRQLRGGSIVQPTVSNLRITGTFVRKTLGITHNDIQRRQLSASNEQDRHGLDIMGNFKKEWKIV